MQSTFDYMNQLASRFTAHVCSTTSINNLHMTDLAVLSTCTAVDAIAVVSLPHHVITHLAISRCQLRPDCIHYTASICIIAKSEAKRAQRTEWLMHGVHTWPSSVNAIISCAGPAANVRPRCIRMFFMPACRAMSHPSELLRCAELPGMGSAPYGRLSPRSNCQVWICKHSGLVQARDTSVL